MKKLNLALVALTLLASAPVFATDFTVLQNTSSVTFTSDATLETITGTSMDVAGVISTDPSAPSNTTATITVPVASLSTGVDMRDEHLHSDQWLNAAANPDITFAITGVTLAEAGATLSHGASLEATVNGTFSLHGASQPLSVPATISFFEVANPEVGATYGITGDVLRVESNFSIALADYGISVPGPLTLKVAPTIDVAVRLTATAAAAQ